MKTKHIIAAAISLVAIAVLCDFALDEELPAVFAAFVFTPILPKSGDVSMPGMQKYILFVPETSVTTVPAPKKDANGNRTNPTVAAGEFAFATGASLRYVACTVKSVGHKSETQGESGSKSFKQTAEFYVPGNENDLNAFASEVINTPGYLVLADSDGRQILMGQEEDPVELTASGDLGKACTDAKGFQFSCEWDCRVSALYLETAIDIAELKTVQEAAE